MLINCCFILLIDSLNVFIKVSSTVVAVPINFADISPERKGNGGESIYGLMFEGMLYSVMVRTYYITTLLDYDVDRQHCDM